MKKLTALLFVLLGTVIWLGGVFFLWEYFENNKKSDFSAGSAPEKLEIIDIDRVVQNCSIKDKQWAFPDGFWGGNFPELFFKNGKLMIAYWDSSERGEVLDLRPFDWNEDGSYFIYSGAKFALEQAAKSQLLSNIAYDTYDEGQMYCSFDDNDEDCQINYQHGAWSDEVWNYFVSGTKKEYYRNVYEINGKLYDPTYSQSSKDRLEKVSTEKWGNSGRFFAGVLNGKILVKRFLNYRVNENELVKIEQGNWKPELFKTEFQLQTCEIPL